MNVAITKFASPRDVSPSREELTWSDFVAMFLNPILAPCTLANCALSACPHKRGPAWSPALYASAVGRWGDVTSISLLVFDVEHATDAQIYEVRGRIDGYRHLVHATHSDRPDNRCVRIIIALSRPVPRELWKAFWTVAQQTIVPIADVGCSDAGRMYFLPSVPGDAGYSTQVNDGEPLDVDAALVIARAASLVAAPVVEGEVSP